jgi:uroporphyrinogen-III decarboxylase
MNSCDGFIAPRPSDKQRFRDALSHKQTAEIPFMEVYVAEHIVNAVMGRPMGGHMLTLNAKDYLEFLQRVGMDVGYLHGAWPLGRKTIKDCHNKVHYADGLIKSRSDLNSIALPSLDAVRKRLDEFFEAAVATNIGLQFAVSSSVTCVCEAIGPTDSLIAINDDPDFVNDFMDIVERYFIPLVEMAVQYPLEAIWTTGLQCMNTGPMISPRMHEEYVFPRLEKILKIIKPSGIPVILHTDGDNSQFMDWIASAGFKGLHPIEPGIGNFDIYDIKQNYGKIMCLFGNIDIASVLTTGTQEDVRHDTLEHLDRLSCGGGYVCGSSHDIGENVPFENFRTMVETICSYKYKDR